MREILTSPRILDLKRKKKREHARLVVLFSILFISIVGSTAYFSAHPRVTINAIEVVGTKIINSSDIEKTVKEHLSGRYFYLFSRANAFLYPHDHIYIDLLDLFPRIESLSVERTSINKLRIQITERIGSHLYCGTAPIDSSTYGDENCYFINDDGYIFDRAPYFSGDVYFKFYGPLLELKEGEVVSQESPLGRHMLSVERFHEIVGFIEGLKTLGFYPIGLSMGDDGGNTITLFRAQGAGHPIILFRNDNDLGEIFENLSVSMNKPEFRNEIQSKYNTLLYIDLRFKNKVLYKFNDE